MIAAIEERENTVFVSAVGAIEVTIRFRSGKLGGVERLANGFENVVRQAGFLPLPITIEHGQRAGLMPFAHKDPFDRILIAQARIEQAMLVSNETLFDRFGVQRLW